MLNKIIMFISLILIIFIFSSCEETSRPFTATPPDMTTRTLTWDQNDPQPDYWEMEISSVRCGQEDETKMFTSDNLSYTYIPDNEFPDYKNLVSKVRAVIGEQRSDWSDAIILKR